MISIRLETPNDRDAVRRVIVDAFTDSDFGDNGEADIVDLLRDDCDEALSLVAIDGDIVVGHIFFSPVFIDADAGEVGGMGLAPVAVVPDRQRTGIGTALVESGLKQLADDGCPFVVVLGHSQYYQRFGFVPAIEYGISHGFEGIPQEVFSVNIFDQNAIRSIAGGTAIYRPEFGPQHPTDNRSLEPLD